MSTFLSGGVPIRLDVHEPAAPTFPAILLLHGAGGNVDRWINYLAPAVNRIGFALYAVHYFDRTNTTRAEPALILDGIHFPLWLQTVTDAIHYVSHLPRVDPDRIALVGISLGAFLSLSAGAITNAVRAIVDISGGLPTPYDAAATPSFPPTLIVHGTADTIVPVSHAQALDVLLQRLGVSHQALILPNEGHWFSPGANLQILAAVSGFLQKRLK